LHARKTFDKFIELYLKSMSIQTNRVFLTSQIRYSRYLIIYPAGEHLNLIKRLIFIAIKRAQQQEVLRRQRKRERMYTPRVYITCINKCYPIALSLLSASQNERFTFLHILTKRCVAQKYERVYVSTFLLPSV
jgi:hypothetical protein